MVKIIPYLNRFLGISKKPPLSRPVFKAVTSDGYVVHSDIPVMYKDGKAILTTHCDPSNGFFSTHSMFTRVVDSNGETLGTYDYSLNPREDKISDGMITTYKQFRRKDVGELMRLASIMEFNENCINVFELISRIEAVPFHIKYKFFPNLKGEIIPKKILEGIVNNKNAKEEFRIKAEELLAQTQNDNPLSLSTENLKKINTFIADFINKHIDRWDKVKFDFNLPMILTSSKLEQFAGFYNKLFKKHGIDYTI